MLRRHFTALLLTLSAVAALPAAAHADHAWYVNGQPAHWASTVEPAQVDLGENLSDPVWESLGHIPAFVWSLSPSISGELGLSPVLRVNLRAGGLPSNEVELYDDLYGPNGWIGQATISVDAQGHITNGTVQLNRSYTLSQSQKHAAINHEVGHTLGLDHEDTTVMCAVLCGIENPVSHDYEVLTDVNAHVDAYSTTVGDVPVAAPVGRATVRRHGPRAVVYVTRLRNKGARVIFRDFVSKAAATAALRG